MKNKKEISIRLYITFALTCFLGLAVVVKIFAIQLFQGPKWEERARQFTEVVRDIEPTRGQIYSSNGSLLSSSIPEFSFYWDSKHSASFSEDLHELDTIALYFSKTFKDKSKEDYKSIFMTALREGNRYQLIKRKVDYHDRQKIKSFPYLNESMFKYGMIEQKQLIRKKPFGELASRTIGIDRENSRVGLELAYNKELAGQKGTQLMEKIAGNAWLPMTDEYIIKPVQGADLHTSIDIHLQDVASNALETQLKQHGAQWGVAILMEVETGYIKAISNLSIDAGDGNYYESLNRAIAETCEPGSTFKLASIMALLDEGYVSLKDSIDTGNGIQYFHGKPMRDSNYDKGGNGVLSVEEVFELSSNIGTALLVDKHFGKNPQSFLDKLYRMGVNQPLGISIKGERAPKIYRETSEEGWSGLSLTQMSIGYELQQTPMQTLALYNAVANNGKLMKPQFCTALRKDGATIRTIEPVVLQESICSKETVAKCQKMMAGVTEDGGTADRIFKGAPYTVAGKTGTAWLFDKGEYQRGKYRASFVGYFPADAPKYSCIVVINKPTSGYYYGSTIAAPVFKEIADKIYASEFANGIQGSDNTEEIRLQPISKNGYRKDLEQTFALLGIPTETNATETWAVTNTQKDLVQIENKTTPQGLVPNVKGMGLRDALYLLEGLGLYVEITGKGSVKSQSIAPGSRVKDFHSIKLELTQ